MQYQQQQQQMQMQHFQQQMQQPAIMVAHQPLSPPSSWVGAPPTALQYHQPQHLHQPGPIMLQQPQKKKGMWVKVKGIFSGSQVTLNWSTHMAACFGGVCMGPLHVSSNRVERIWYKDKGTFEAVQSLVRVA